MPTPLVSICIPAYKAGPFIYETLLSIHAQTFTDWEVIVIEDGSKDNTEQIVHAFAEASTQPVGFQRHTVNQGLPATRNTAIAAARGEWIALIDSDDLWTPHHLEHAVAHARKSGADLVHTGVIMFDSDTGKDLELRVPSAAAIAALPLSLFRGDYPIQPSSTLIRRDTLTKAGGFDPKCRYVEDRELWCRLARAGARISYVDALTCRYRQHAGAMTKNAPAMALGVAEVFERNTDWAAIPLEIRRERASSAWLDAGRLILRTDPRTARAYFAKARRHSRAPRILAYSAAAFLLSLVKGRPPQPSS
ncbi:glycosyl transferase [Nibricoccus aquaticus]|uniref:Glycosyl transferase n=1 Tax=Nibricoccus aquaticus TaxID=2576891 RepID=A0A290QH57_9BACT|nr:glycosyltransferase [Nibricoccus aquaticus]ATC63691.1 glycosyl transferase [Nibricoccus aquaticus]